METHGLKLLHYRTFSVLKRTTGPTPREEETMTARAFLRLSEGLREAFASAQDDETLRYLRVEVVDGDCLEAVGSKQKGDLETDFDDLAQASASYARGKRLGKR